MESDNLNQSENQKENNNNNQNTTNYEYISDNGNKQHQINRKGKKLTVHDYYKIQTEKYLEGLKQKQESATEESEQLANSFEAPNTCDTSSQILQNDSEVFQRNKNKKHSTKQYYKGKVLELVQKFAKNSKTLQSNSSCSNQTTCKQDNNEINEQQLAINAQQISQNQEQNSMWNNEYQQAIKIKKFQESIKIEQFINLEIIPCNADEVSQNQDVDVNANELEQQNQLVVHEEQEVEQNVQEQQVEQNVQEQQVEQNVQEQIIETQQIENPLQEQQNEQLEVNLNQNSLIIEEDIILKEIEKKDLQVEEQIQIQDEQQKVQVQTLENQQEKEEEDLNEFLNKNLNTVNENPPSQTVSALKGNRRNQSMNKQQKQERQVQFPQNLENDEQEKRNNLILGQNEGIKLDLSKLNAINKQDQRKRRLETQSANSKRSIRSNWTTKTFKEKAEEVAMPAVGTAVVGSVGLFLAKNVLKGKSKLLGIVPALACSAYYYYKIKKQNEVEEELQDEIQDDDEINSDEEEQEDDSTKVYQ